MGGLFKNGISAGVVAGVIWGWLTMAVNAVTGVFPFEGTFTHNLVTFAAAGAIFGIVVGVVLVTGGRFLPVKSQVGKGVVISTAIWLLLRIGGIVLSAMEPHRYHLLTAEFFQGIVLAVILGALLGLFSRGANGARGARGTKGRQQA